MVLGITGNIASGKSAVAEEFRRLGAVVVDADQLAREAVEPGSAALEQLVGVFGAAILDERGRLNRERLGDIVFADEKARQRLGDIVHPAIAELAEARLKALRRRPDIPLIVYEAPLLFEAGAQGRVDRVLVVRIDPRIQLQRLINRNGLEVEDAKKRMAAQLNQDEKLKRADYVIDNSGPWQETRVQVGELWNLLTV